MISCRVLCQPPVLVGQPRRAADHRADVWRQQVDKNNQLLPLMAPDDSYERTLSSKTTRLNEREREISHQGFLRTFDIDGKKTKQVRCTLRGAALT